MGLSVVTAPTVLPVSMAEAKAHLRIDDDYSDTLIYGLIKAATNHVEAVTRRRLVQQTLSYTLPDFPAGDIILPVQPVSSVSSVNYINASGVSTAFTSFTLINDGPKSRVVLNYNVSWPSTREHGNAVTVQFVAGYDPTTDSPQSLTGNIPSDLKTAILLIVGDLYENREATPPFESNPNPAVTALISPYILRDF